MEKTWNSSLFIAVGIVTIEQVTNNTIEIMGNPYFEFLYKCLIISVSNTLHVLQTIILTKYNTLLQ